ncbi:MAG: tetratricopeptide repeat protein [Burkholderiales bacterium]|nr:tetratricopeptide repeat protein [Burkholderiales bacterium]
MNTTIRQAPARSTARWILAAALAAGSTIGASGAAAQGISREMSFYSPQALSLLPPYCRYTQIFRDEVPGANDPARIKYWYGVLGGEFHHLHHYCWALTHANNATFASKLTTARRKALYGAAIREVNYVIRNSSPRFVLAPEILTKRGEWHARLDANASAIPDFAKAIELKPDYWPAYAGMSDMYQRAGDTARAREWLEKGLAQVPDSRALRQKLAELGRAPRATARPEKADAPAPGGKPDGAAGEASSTGEQPAARPN